MSTYHQIALRAARAELDRIEQDISHVWKNVSDDSESKKHMFGWKEAIIDFITYIESKSAIPEEMLERLGNMMQLRISNVLWDLEGEESEFSDLWNEARKILQRELDDDRIYRNHMFWRFLIFTRLYAERVRADN